MPTLLQRKIEELKKEVLFLGATVEERVKMVIRAVDSWDTDLAGRIIESDYDINEKEVEIEEFCLEIIARYQPVAVDLRFLSAVIKINNDLERIGDEAVNIAERVLIVAKDDKAKFTFDYSSMAEKAEFMLRRSLDALVNLDLDLAVHVCVLDEEVDQLKNDVYDVVKRFIQDDSQRTGYLINLLLISRHLERIADHATNIAEEVIYLIEGHIARHGKFGAAK
jgi:phosphate transport system protein